MIRWNGKDYSPRRFGQSQINQSIEELMKPLSEKKFKGNVWRAHIIGDVQPTSSAEPVSSPTPTPSVTATLTPTPTPNAVCALGLTLDGLGYSQTTSYTGGTFTSVYCEYTGGSVSTFVYDTTLSGASYPAFVNVTYDAWGPVYNTLYYFIVPTDSTQNGWVLETSYGNTPFNISGNTLGGGYVQTYSTIVDNVAYPQSGYSAGPLSPFPQIYFSYQNPCTPTPTPSITPSPSSASNVTFVGSQVPYNLGYTTNNTDWSDGFVTIREYEMGVLAMASNGSVWRGFGRAYDTVAPFVDAYTSIYSNDGVKWSTGNTSYHSFIGTVTGNLRVATANSLWVMGGSASYAQLLSGGSITTLGYSNDGITYSAATITIPSGRVRNQAISGIAYGNGIWLAGGSSTGTTTTNSRLLYSNDGMSWTGVSTSFFSANIGQLSFGNGKFVCTNSIAGNSKLAASTDGVNWTASTNAADATVFSTLPVTGVIFHKDKFIAYSSQPTGATSNVVAYSTDGLTWSGATSTKPLMPRGPVVMASNQNNLVIAAGPLANSTSLLMYQSTDGISWSANTGSYTPIFSGNSMSSLTSKAPMY